MWSGHLILEETVIAEPILGTANLFATVGTTRSQAVLDAAWDEGFRAFDTAPSYGYGEGEIALARMLPGRRDQARVTTKAGLGPANRPGRTLRIAKMAARRLPSAAQNRLRRSISGGPSGNFSPAAVQRSIDSSLSRLVHIDRLLLHEVTPNDLTDELLDRLTTYQKRGDVGQIGVATANRLTVDCIARAPDLLVIAQVAAGPFDEPVEFLPNVTYVGHGLLGPEGADLRLLQGRLSASASALRQWQERAARTRWDAPSGVADVLLARAVGTGLDGAIVATSRPERLAATRAILSGEEKPPHELLTIVRALVDQS